MSYDHFVVGFGCGCNPGPASSGLHPDRRRPPRRGLSCSLVVVQSSGSLNSFAMTSNMEEDHAVATRQCELFRSRLGPKWATMLWQVGLKRGGAYQRI